MSVATAPTDVAERPAPQKRASLTARLLMMPIRAWRLVSVHLPPRCRFAPSCSEYAIDALATHGAWRGAWLALRRLSRCHPWGGSGFDPVPPNTRSLARTGAGRLGGPETRAG